MFKNKNDLYPVAVILIGALLSLAPFLTSQLATSLCLLTIGLLFRILTPIHQHCHAHVPVFKSSWLNVGYDFVLSLAGGNLTSVWRVHHVMAHHQDFLKPEKDLEGYLRFGDHGRFTRTVFTLFGDGLSLWDCLVFLRSKRKTLRHLHYHSLFRQASTLASAYILLFLLNAKAFFICFFIPNLFLRWIVFWFSYVQHAHLPAQDVYSSCTTNFRNRWWLLNVGYHTAHHEMPNLHWTQLPNRTEKILHRIPDVCLKGHGIAGLPQRGSS